jgi:hypothetical protein
MLLIVAAVLLIAWVGGVSLLDVGSPIHILLLIGLMLLLLGFLKARDAATTAERAGPRPDQK